MAEPLVAWERAQRLRELTAPGRALILDEPDELVTLTRDLLADLETANTEAGRQRDLYMRCVAERAELRRDQQAKVNAEVERELLRRERSIAAKHQVHVPFGALLTLIEMLGDRAGTKQVENLKAAARRASHEIAAIKAEAGATDAG